MSEIGLLRNGSSLLVQYSLTVVSLIHGRDVSGGAQLVHRTILVKTLPVFTFSKYNRNCNQEILKVRFNRGVATCSYPGTDGLLLNFSVPMIFTLLRLVMSARRFYLSLDVAVLSKITYYSQGCLMNVRPELGL